MVVVLLTGPIKSGKKTVVDIFQNYNFRWVDVTSFLDEAPLDNLSETLDRVFSLSTLKSSSDVPSFSQALPPQPLSIENASHSSRLLRLKALENQLLQYYSDNLVLTGISHICDIRVLSARPFTVVLGVDAPLPLRYCRWRATHRQLPEPHCSIEDSTLDTFVQLDTAASCGCSDCEQSEAYHDENEHPRALASSSSSRKLPNAGVYFCTLFADVVLRNTGTKNALAVSIARLNIGSPDVFRPNYDTYFMHLAQETAMRSNCLRRCVGAVITVDNKVVATGYNGTPTGCVNCLSGGCSRCQAVNLTQGVDLDKCICVHAEANALLQAGLSRSRNATMYVTCFPCLSCAKLILQGEIIRLVYNAPYDNNPTTLELFSKVSRLPVPSKKQSFQNAFRKVSRSYNTPQFFEKECCPFLVSARENNPLWKSSLKPVKCCSYTLPFSGSLSYNFLC